MDYIDGVKYMEDKCKGVYKKYGVSFSPTAGITIECPGYKKLGDYRMMIKGKPPRHIDICKQVFDRVTKDNYEDYVALIERLYEVGTYAKDGFDDELVDLLYWVSLQEDINYPQPRYEGRKRALSRFFEAMFLKVSTNDMGCLEARCNAKHVSVLDVNGYEFPHFYIQS